MVRTISDHDDKDDDSEGPFEQNSEDNQGDDDVDKRGNDVEQNQLW
jgi:hypothetical protein